MYNTATQRHTEIPARRDTDYANAVSDIVYGYNNMGELASVTVLKENGQTPTAVASSTIYDALGGTSTTTLPNTVYTYDAGGRLETTLDSATGITTKYTYKPNTNYVQTETVTNAAGTTLASYTYTYRADGLKTGETDTTYNSDGTVNDTRTLAWTYDGLDRLTQETSTDTAGVAALNYTDNYTYDLNGNRVSETTDNTNGTDTITSTYNADNQLTQSVDANTGMTVYTYDQNGSQIETIHTPNGTTTPDSTTTSEYTLQDKLAGIQNKNGSGAVTSSALYIYDDQGNRVEVTTVTGSNSPVTTYFLVDGNNPTGYAQVIEQSATPGTPTISYIWGGGLIEQDNAAGTTNAGIYYLIADGQGSTQVLVSSTGDVVQTYNYDSSGNALGFAPDSAITDYLYNQQYYDVVSGQYYLRARNYDPATGTFTQQDSYTINPGDLANANLYLYAGADPINMFDPSGMVSMELGTAVHSFLNRAFEGFTGITPGFLAIGGNPGPRLRRGPGRNLAYPDVERWANRRISSIARGYGNLRSTDILRPDFVEVDTEGTSAGSLYELKPLGITGLFSAAASLFAYYAALNLSVPNVGWSFGRSWAPGLTEWPSFTSPLLPPSSRLITYDNYSVYPGAIFYYVVGLDRLAEVMAAAAAGIYSLTETAGSLQAVAPALDYAATAAPTVEALDATEMDTIGFVGFSADVALAA